MCLNGLIIFEFDLGQFFFSLLLADSCGHESYLALSRLIKNSTKSFKETVFNLTLSHALNIVNLILKFKLMLLEVLIWITLVIEFNDSRISSQCRSNIFNIDIASWILPQNICNTFVIEGGCLLMGHLDGRSHYLAVFLVD